jgi:hypothetical protein
MESERRKSYAQPEAKHGDKRRKAPTVAAHVTRHPHSEDHGRTAGRLLRGYCHAQLRLCRGAMPAATSRHRCAMASLMCREETAKPPMSASSPSNRCHHEPGIQLLAHQSRSHLPRSLSAVSDLVSFDRAQVPGVYSRAIPRRSRHADFSAVTAAARTRHRIHKFGHRARWGNQSFSRAATMCERNERFPRRSPSALRCALALPATPETGVLRAHSAPPHPITPSIQHEQLGHVTDRSSQIALGRVNSCAWQWLQRTRHTQRPPPGIAA